MLSSELRQKGDALANGFETVLGMNTNNSAELDRSQLSRELIIKQISKRLSKRIVRCGPCTLLVTSPVV